MIVFGTQSTKESTDRLKSVSYFLTSISFYVLLFFIHTITDILYRTNNSHNFNLLKNLLKLLIKQMVEFYLGSDFAMAPQLLSYGCWCQILGDQRKHGLGEPLDTLDQICKGYLDLRITN